MTEHHPSPVYPRTTTAPGAASTVPASPSFPSIEERILRGWSQDQTFEASVAERPAVDDAGQPNEFVFYDGPPFANGLPHYGHLLTGYVKDLVARYQTQRGHRVERRFGWDTHGLPAELEAMKQLGMTDKADIEAMGIDTFNDICRSSVLKYTKEWEEYVNRQARWVDFENDYKTLNVDYMESVIWAFKQLHEKGLTYEGFRVLPYCWKDETPLSNHELRMDDDVYKERQDPSVTVAFPITGGGDTGDALRGVNLLAWTTTPWTLPTNFSVAVGPEIEYSVVQAPADGPFPGRHLVGSELVGAYAKDLGFVDTADVAASEQASAAVVARYQGTDLAGLEYQPLWAYYADTERWGTEHAFRVLLEDYVTTSDGTGLVHQASAYGEEDQRSSEEAGIPVILSVDEGARFLPMFAEPTPDGDAPLADIAGVQVFEANRSIIRALRGDGRLVREQSYAHSYPHCWRCRTPLIYKAVTSWYVAVTQIKDRMLEHNEKINWIPGNVKHGQFGKWLENARDWSISRNRYWGSPIPVWVSDDPDHPRTEVYGSLAELQEAFGDVPRNASGEPDLHRPWIDQLTRPNPDDPTGRSRMVRVSDVLDVWFDSGSMQFAQVHYPFEDAQWFEDHHPADFIVEYIGQTRGWFYTMHILATALFDRPAFTNVISHGVVLGSDGHKMSKSLQNYPDVSEVLDRDGSDAMRWFLMASPILRGGNLVVTEEGIREGVRQVLLPMWNAWHFFALYANTADGGSGYSAQIVRGEDVENPLDRYILAATGDLVRDATAALDAYDVSSACDALRAYSDTLTNWYIRRSRQRFYAEETQAYDVLYTALETFARVAAPLLPLMSEEIWRGLTGGRSVHLADWPDPADYLKDERSVKLMDLTRVITSAGASLRKGAKLRVRQPLARLTVVVPDAAALAGTYQQIIAEELNIKVVELIDAGDAAASEWGVGQQLVVNARAAGPRLGKDVQTAIKGAKSGDWSVTDGAVTTGGLRLQDGEYSLTTTASAELADQAVTVLDGVHGGAGGGFLVLHTSLTAELRAEGAARDMIRSIQQARKDADLQVADRIRTMVTAAPSTVEALRTHRDLVRQETLTDDLQLVADDAADTPLVSVAVAG